MGRVRIQTAKAKLLARFEREGIKASVGLADNTLVVSLNDEKNSLKVPSTYYGYKVEVKVIGMVVLQPNATFTF